MKYLCLVYYEEATLDALSESEYRALVDETLDYQEQLRKSGRYMTSDTLESAHAATTIRVRNGKVSIADGPFAKTKEQLGGLCLIKARDLNEAIRVASKLPLARLGCVEIRPIKEDGRPSSAWAGDRFG